jgi:transposase-like protein
MVAAAIRTIFAQPTGQEVVDQVDKVAAMLAGKFPAVARMLTDAREDLTAFASFSMPRRLALGDRRSGPHAAVPPGIL